MVRIVCLLIGYLFGLFQTAYFYGKMKGIDIRKHGSGNAGTTNTLRVLGFKAGLIVLAGDLLKCALALVLVRCLLGQSHADMLYLLLLYTAAGVIIGHDFPFYMHFKGGKGIAATAGLIAAFHPYFIPMGLIVFFSIFFTSFFSSAKSLFASSYFFGSTPVFGRDLDVFPFDNSTEKDRSFKSRTLTI